MPLPHVSAGGQGPDTTATLRRAAQGLPLSGAGRLQAYSPDSRRKPRREKLGFTDS